jgi:haloalkane dehalogenase
MYRFNRGVSMTFAGAADEVLRTHREAGTTFEASGVRSFVRADGSGPPVVLVHGLPMSSFLYRKLLPLLAADGMRAVAFDLPGLGLADRPEGFDYTLAGLGRFSAAAVDSLGLDQFHLVVHDAGGPVGFELAALSPGRVLSLTILNTTLAMRRMPFPGEVYARIAHQVRGPMGSFRAWRRMLDAVGVVDPMVLSDVDVEVHRRLALGSDGGAGYLNIMRVLRQGHDRGRYSPVIDSRAAGYPIQVVWGARDPLLRLRREGLDILRVSGLSSITALSAKHYLQEERAAEVSDLIVRQAEGVTRS